MKNLVSFRSLILLVGALLSYPLNMIAQEEAAETATVVVERSRPMYERFGMTSTQLFILMISITIILVIVLVSVSFSAKRLIELKGAKKIKNAKNILLLIGGLFLASDGFAAEPVEIASMEIPFPDTSFWILLSFDIILIMLILYITGIMNGIMYEWLPKRKSRLWKAFQRRLVDATPVAEEASILMDHDYDGIKELDNNLPPWWKYGFYVTIAWALVYFTYYQVLGGPTQEEEFITAVEEGEREVAEYKAAHPELVTEESAEFLTDASTLSRGRSIFTEKCVTCHAEGGAGAAGPNLTDDYWIYGNDITTVFHTISEGAKNGMRSWKDELNGTEIQAVASYVLQLEPILPPQGQEPLGDYYPPEE